MATTPRRNRSAQWLRLSAWAACALWLLAGDASFAQPESAAPTAAELAPPERLPDLLVAEGARELGPGDLKAKPTAFPAVPGERIEYEVAYLGAPIGSFVLEVVRFIEHEGRRLAHVVAIARTNPVFSAVYRIFDQTEAWIDLDTLRTHVSRSYTERGAKRNYYELRLDWETHYLHLHREQRHKGKIRDLAFDFGPNVHDILDLYYQLRRVDPRPGFEAVLPVYASRKVYGFHVTVLEETQLEREGREPLPVIVLSPSTSLDGERLSSDDTRMYLGRERRGVPVRLDGWMGVTGSFIGQGVRADLTRYTPAGPGWKPPAIQPWEPDGEALRTQKGMPRWDPPEALEALREARGVEYSNEKRYVDPKTAAWDWPDPAAAEAAQRSAPAPASGG